jgi:hypothetical protein
MYIGACLPQALNLQMLLEFRFGEGPGVKPLVDETALKYYGSA